MHVKYLLTYTTFVCSILDYASIILSPYYQSCILAQRRAARFVMNKYGNYESVSQMLDFLGWNTLEDRHNKLRAIVKYKTYNCRNSISDVPISAPTRRHHHRFQQLPTKVDSYK